MVEIADVHRVEEPKARKPHSCYECHGPIEAGEAYKRVTTLFDGAWTTMKICDDCWHLGLTFEDWEYGMLSENVKQGFKGHDNPPPEILRFYARYYASLSKGAPLKTAPFIMGEFGEQARDLGFGYRRVAYALKEAADLLQQASNAIED